MDDDLERLLHEESLAREAARAREAEIHVGDDETTRREKDMGLDINPDTGRAYESQGSFQNMGLGAGGRFYDGRAVPRSVRCTACEAVVLEAAWGQGFENCGAFDFGPGGSYFLCSECVARVLRVFPRIRGFVSAMTGGKITSG